MPVRRVAIVVGTRPELIKMAPVFLELRRRADFETRLIATAQHRQMLDQMCEALGIIPDVDLDLMLRDQTASDVFARVTTGMQLELSRQRPHALLVHGDTTTCLASALAAFHERIPIGHVEAGLRTYDFSAPWPEEMNRRLTDPISRWCFAPTAQAADNLRAERIPAENIFITGNTAIDALVLGLGFVRGRVPAIAGLPANALDGRRLVLVTAHRRENFGEPLRRLCLALRDIAERHTDVVIVYPVHLNPNVRQVVQEMLSGRERIYPIPPLDYLAFVSLMNQAYLILTDSGGIQEEAPTLKRPVLVMRQTTERPEAVAMGVARLVGTAREVIVMEASRLLNDPAAYAAMTAVTNPYGDGLAAERIADVLARTV